MFNNILTRSILVFPVLLAAAVLAAPVTAPAPPTPKAPAPIPNHITLETLVVEMVDYRVVSKLPDNSFTCKQFSSYDPASVSPTDPATWFANDDRGHVLRVQEVAAGNGTFRKEFVLADCAGPGAIVRIWTPNPQGTLRIYVDGNSVPVIEGPMEQLMAGKSTISPPFAADHSRGWNIYLPIPYAKACLITTDSNNTLYYQINYRTYSDSALVQSLSPEVLKATAPILAEAGKRIANTPRPPFKPAQSVETLAPGQRHMVGGTTGSRAISSFLLKLDAPDMAKALRQVIIRMDFDYEKTVWVPVGDFFGIGPDTKPFQTHYLEYTLDREMISRFFMPYSRSGRIFIDNQSDQTVTVDLRINSTKSEFTDKTMRFHATWNYSPSIHTKAAAGTEDFNYVSVDGSGILVGDILTVFNPVKAWWGEGDEHIYVDGETFPSHFGTGTEDYYGYGWCDQRPFIAPFNAQLRCDGFNPNGNSNNRGFTTLTRQRALDTIPFTKSLKFDMEVWHWAKTEVSYAATTFFYALPGASVNHQPQLDLALQRLPQVQTYSIPSAIECESASIAAKSEGTTAEPQDMSGYPDGKWSQETHLWVKGKKLGDFVELTIPAKGETPRKLTLHATKSWDYGTVSISVNGIVAAANIDLFSGEKGKVIPTEIDLGEHTPLLGNFIIRVELTGANKDSAKPQTYFGLDCLTITP